MGDFEHRTISVVRHCHCATSFDVFKAAEPCLYLHRLHMFTAVSFFFFSNVGALHKMSSPLMLSGPSV